MAKPTGTGFTRQRMDLLTRAIGSKMFKKGMERRLGLINLILKANIKKELNMEKENTSTPMGLYTKEIGVIIKYLVKVLTLGPMEKAMKGSGLTIICMVTELSHGRMEGDIKVTT